MGGIFKEYTLSENERPRRIFWCCAIKILKRQSPEADAGAAISNILLAAHAKGLGTCWMGAVDREAVKEIIGIPDNLQLMYVISLVIRLRKATAFDNTGDINILWTRTGQSMCPNVPLTRF